MKNSSTERNYFDHFVDLENQRRAVSEDLKELAKEASEAGVDVKILRLSVKRHLESAKSRARRVDLETAAAQLLEALGEFVNTPLGDAAKKVAESGSARLVGAIS